MNNKDSSVVIGAIGNDQDTSYQAREQVLNAAILQADISENFEQYLAIFNTFYADDIQVSSEPQNQPVRGKARVRSLLAEFLVPLHIMAEIGGLLVSVRESPIACEVSGETHSLWTVELVGVSGRTCTLSWCVARKWKGPYVVSEHYYDHEQTAGPLTSGDLSCNGLGPVPGLRRPSC